MKQIHFQKSYISTCKNQWYCHSVLQTSKLLTNIVFVQYSQYSNLFEAFVFFEVNKPHSNLE